MEIKFSVKHSVVSVREGLVSMCSISIYSGGLFFGERTHDVEFDEDEEFDSRLDDGQDDEGFVGEYDGYDGEMESVRFWIRWVWVFWVTINAGVAHWRMKRIRWSG